MKAFFVGLIFLLAVAILTGVGFLLFPLLMLLSLLLRITFAFMLMIFAIWLLGKTVIFILDKFRN